MALTMWAMWATMASKLTMQVTMASMLASCRCHDDGDVRDEMRDDAGVDGVDERGVGWGRRVRCMLWEVRCVSA